MQLMSKKKLELIIGFLLLIVLSLIINYAFSSSKSKVPSAIESGKRIVKVHYINVGEGDSILIEADKHSMLIDAGDNSKGVVVADYLKAAGIKKLDYVIATHPHYDHIGGLKTVLRSFPVKQLIMPNLFYTTKTFRNLLDTITAEKINVKKANVGDHYTLGSTSFTILSPKSNRYNEINDYSVVTKLVYGKTSFLFDGDAQKRAEKEMLKSTSSLTCDAIKIAHHGAKDASSINFLNKVHPSYAIISVGKNDFGIPDHEVLQALVDRKISIYRTDKQGNIVLTSNGRTISVNTNPYKITQEDMNDKPNRRKYNEKIYH